MKYFVDTCIFIYAASEGNRFKESCVRFLSKVEKGSVQAAISTEVVQEVFNYYNRKGMAAFGASLCWRILGYPVEVLAVSRPDVMAFLRLVGEAKAQASARDFLHAAVMLNNGIEKIVTVDADFDAFKGLRRIPPEKA